MYQRVLQKFRNQEMSNEAGSSKQPNTNDPTYGRPIQGSLTEMRGKKASIHVSMEMLQLCEIIDSNGFPNPTNPQLKVILFGDLFDIYVYISNKVVGLLLRARKHGLVNFEGEMLFQRRDDNVPIYLLKPIWEIQQMEKNLLDHAEKEFSNKGKALPTTVLLDQMKR